MSLRTIISIAALVAFSTTVAYFVGRYWRKKYPEG